MIVCQSDSIQAMASDVASQGSERHYEDLDIDLYSTMHFEYFQGLSIAMQKPILTIN